MKKVTELKDGMKVWIPFEVDKLEVASHYPFICSNSGANLIVTKDCRLCLTENPIEMYEQELVPTLTPVEMEVSLNGINWTRMNVIGKIGDNKYLAVVGNYWRYARPIRKTVTLEIPESELTDELRKYLKR